MPRLAPHCLEFDRVTKTYRSGWLGRRQLRALDDVSLHVATGRTFGLVGPNRAGKTTLVKLLLTISRPTAGRITRLGRPWRDRGTLARIGYVHERQAFPGYLTPTQLLELYGRLSGVGSHDLRRRSRELLERVDLADRAQSPISNFSKGMVQRLALAQALVNEPELLVLDEPTEGLDLPARQLVHDILLERRSKGRSVLLVTHQLSDVERLCDDVAVLRNGRVVFTGPPSLLVDRAATRAAGQPISTASAAEVGSAANAAGDQRSGWPELQLSAQPRAAAGSTPFESAIEHLYEEAPA
ncbi:MAG: ABC transporter ATP-binding protein [Pirellulales bacterium]